MQTSTHESDVDYDMAWQVEPQAILCISPLYNVPSVLDMGETVSTCESTIQPTTQPARLSYTQNSILSLISLFPCRIAAASLNI